MSNKTAYTYTVLRYVHDLATGEFLNDSSLQWSPVGSGLTADPGLTLEQLYERFVTAHEPN